jgi:hypothetical protein
MVSGWGKPVGTRGVFGSKTSGLYPVYLCGVFCPVYNPGGFTILIPQFFQMFSHNFKLITNTVTEQFLPIINTLYKNNNKLIKPILLLGGCV